MPDTPNVSLLGLIWSVLLSCVMALLAIGGFRAKVVTKKDLVDSENAMLKRIYNNDGSSIYMPRAECGQSRAGCSGEIRRLLDEIKQSGHNWHVEVRDELALSRKELSEAQIRHSAQHEDISQFIGAVKQFIDNHNKNGG